MSDEPGPDVYGSAELQQLLKISHTRLAQLRERDDFPHPRDLKSGPVWDGPEIRAWKHDHRDTPRRQRTGAYGRTLQLVRLHGVKPTARMMGVHPTTVRARMRRMGAPLPGDEKREETT